MAAHVLQADGSYRTLAGTGTADGHFSIPDVPSGPYVLQVRNVFVQTERSTLDLGSHAHGRPDVRTTTPGDGTTLVFRVGGMTPWKKGDQLQLFSVGAGLGYFLLTGDDSYSSALDGPPLEGDTRFDHALDFRMSRWMEHLKAISFCDGPDWNGIREGSLLVAGQTGGTLAHGVYGNLPDFLSVRIPESWPDGTTGPLQYGVLPEEDFALFGLLGALCSGRVADPSSATGWASAHGSMSRTDSLTALTQGPLEPRLTPPRALRAEGHPLDVAQDGVGPTPLLAWEAPTIGVPNRYELMLFRLDDQTGIDRLATLYTSEPTLRLPPGLLQSGERYTVWLFAEAQAHPRPASPLRSSFPTERASFTSAPFSP